MRYKVLFCVFSAVLTQSKHGAIAVYGISDRQSLVTPGRQYNLKVDNCAERGFYTTRTVTLLMSVCEADPKGAGLRTLSPQRTEYFTPCGGFCQQRFYPRSIPFVEHSFERYPAPLHVDVKHTNAYNIADLGSVLRPAHKTLSQL